MPPTTGEGRIRACAKGTGRWFKKTLRRFGPKKPEFSDQANSLLFTRLPPELRALIWEFALSPVYLSHEVVPAHFHAYRDAVYDSCTYDAVRKRDQNPHLMQISLLLTCRAIYNEALGFLYKDQDFTITICAGLARPRQNTKRRRSLGRPAACKTLFGRMRSVTLIVQPGDKPHVPTYTAHIGSVLSALDHGQQAHKLTLHFNFGAHSSTSTVRCPIILAFRPLGHFYRTQPSLSRPSFTIHAKRVDPGTSPEKLHKYCDALSLLCVALCPSPSSKGSHCDITSYTLNPPTGNAALDFAGWYPGQHDNRNTGPYCLRRGAWGEYDGYLIRHNIAGRGWQSNIPPPPAIGWRVLLFVTLPVTVPVVVPVVAAWWTVEGAIMAVRKGEC